MKEFDFELAKQGRPVCTRDGRPVRITCFDRRSLNQTDCIVALVTNYVGEETPYTYYKNGKTSLTNSNEYDDLVMKPVKKHGWVNIYNGGLDIRSVGLIFDTEEEAIDESNEGLVIDTIEIEWEE